MPDLGRLTVLIVDDNPRMRALLRAFIAAIEVKAIYEASDGQTGLETFRRSTCDLILCDMTMKPMDGLEFTRRVRNSEERFNPSAPIVMVSGHTEKHCVEAARDAGVSEFLAKPVTAQALFARIAEIVERPRPFVR
ncbi:MAG: response regulator, partial [Rhizomicrobium sp.]